MRRGCAFHGDHVAKGEGAQERFCERNDSGGEWASRRAAGGGCGIKNVCGNASNAENSL